MKLLEAAGAGASNDHNKTELAITYMYALPHSFNIHQCLF